MTAPTADDTETMTHQEPVDDTDVECRPTIKGDAMSETMAENAAAATTDKVYDAVDAATTGKSDTMTIAPDTNVSDNTISGNDGANKPTAPGPDEGKASPEKRSLDEAEAAVAPGSDEKRHKQSIAKRTRE